MIKTLFDTGSCPEKAVTLGVTCHILKGHPKLRLYNLISRSAS